MTSAPTKTTLYNRTSTGKIKVWSIWLELNGFDLPKVHRQWGVLGGALQTTTVEYRGNTQRPIPVDEAEFDLEREIRFKREEGYVDSLDAVRDSSVLNEDDMSVVFATGILPDSFRPAKPVSEITPAKAAKHAAAGDFIIQRKRDGQRHFAVYDQVGAVSLWSRQIENVTEKFPRLVAALQEFPAVSTILDGEIIIDRAGHDDFRSVSSVARADAPKAAAAEAELPVRFYVFDVLYVLGVPLYQQPYSTRYGWILDNIGRLNPANSKHAFIVAPETFDDLDTARALVRQHKWEGLVLWLKDQPTIVRMDGREKRTNCYKDKPVQTRDFLAIGYELGKGKCANVVGKLLLRDKDGNDVGLCGGGFDNKTRLEALSWAYPCVVEVEFDKQEDDTLKLRFPVFIRKRDDKFLHELD